MMAGGTSLRTLPRKEFKMTQRKTWIVELWHVCYKPLQCTKAIEVTLDTNPRSRYFGQRYCTAHGLGCSRNYVADSDSSAIRQFLAEHGLSYCDFTILREATADDMA
jgi:hypothetical protein